VLEPSLAAMAKSAVFQPRVPDDGFERPAALGASVRQSAGRKMKKLVGINVVGNGAAFRAAAQVLHQREPAGA